MAADTPTGPSRSVDRAALERVLARAAELQSTSNDPGDVAGDMTEAQILDLGKEVGLSPQHLRQALAEERTRVALPPNDLRVGTVLFGIASGVRASRVIAGVPDKMLPGIDAWMQREEGLRVKRQLGDRIVWEPRSDFFGNLTRALNFGGRGYALTRAFEVAATVAAVDDTRAVVTLEANLSSHRNQMATSPCRHSERSRALGGHGRARRPRRLSPGGDRPACSRPDHELLHRERGTAARRDPSAARPRAAARSAGTR